MPAAAAGGGATVARSRDGRITVAAAVLGGLGALVCTAGIGEHSPTVRARVCDGLGLLGVALDGAANDASEQIISSLDSRVTLDTVERIRS